MQQAIHATQHSALALNLTSTALSDTAATQKSELMTLLRVVVEDYEYETVQHHEEDPSTLDDGSKNNATTDTADHDVTSRDSVEKITKVRPPMALWGSEMSLVFSS